MPFVAATYRALAHDRAAFVMIHGMEIPADPAAAIIFAYRHDRSVVVGVLPAIFAADLAIERLIVDREGIAMILASDIARQRVATQPPKPDAADNGRTVPVACRTAAQPAAQSTEDCACCGVAAMALLFISARLVIAGVGRRRCVVALRPIARSEAWTRWRSISAVGPVSGPAPVFVIPASFAQLLADRAQLLGKSVEGGMTDAVPAFIVG